MGVFREKACVFLSLILPEISELGLKNLKILGDNFVQALASVTTLFNSGTFYNRLKFHLLYVAVFFFPLLFKCL